MTKHRPPVMLFGFLLMALALLACGPVAPPDDPSPPLVQSSDSTAIPEPTATPEPTQEADEDAAGESEEKPPLTPEPTPSSDNPRPTKGPLPPETPEPEPEPEYELTQDREHPEGLEGCQSVVMLGGDPAHVEYLGWCFEQLEGHVEDTCSSKTTAAAQRECGETIVAEYESYVFRVGTIKCSAISPAGDRRDCLRDSSIAIKNAQGNVFDAWAKVREAGNQDEKVVKAFEATNQCLKEEGFENVDANLLFSWQKVARPTDRRAAELEKELRETLLKPSISCANEAGLFEAQDEAWAGVLASLAESEPDLVKDLINEGFLNALREPGVSVYLSGESPSESSE